MQTLFTWLGNRDIVNMEQGPDAAIVSIATKFEISFDKIVILSNKDSDKCDLFERLLKKRLGMTSR